MLVPAVAAGHALGQQLSSHPGGVRRCEASLADLHASIQRVGKGDFSGSEGAGTGREDTVMVWTRETRTRLAALDQASKQAVQELREGEQRFRDIARISADRIWGADPSGCCTYASESVTSRLGYQPEELPGKTAFDLMAPEEASKVGAAFAAIVVKRSAYRDLEINVPGKDGRPHIALTNGTPIFDRRGELVGCHDLAAGRTGQPHLAKSCPMSLKALNSSALPQGSSRNIVACSPTCPLKRT